MADDDRARDASVVMGGRTVEPRDAARAAGLPDGFVTPISSAPQPGVKYYFRDFEEFQPESLSSGKLWGGSGVYTPSGVDLLTVSFDVPPGATVHDIEWYVYNTSGTASLMLRVFSTGTGTYLASVVDGTTPPTNAMTAVRLVPTTATRGPFPHGTRLVAACTTAANDFIQLNGVRLGLENAPLSPVLLPSPVRVVDSRKSGGPLRNAATRTVSLAANVPAGALGALLNLTAVDTVGTGYLTTYAAGTARPTSSSLNWYGNHQVVANQVTTALSGNRSITLYCRSQTDFVVDLIGYLV